MFDWLKAMFGKGKVRVHFLASNGQTGYATFFAYLAISG